MPAMQHQVVAEDRRVLVKSQGKVPAIVVRVGAVHLADAIGCDMREADATRIEERLAELRDLPVNNGRHASAVEEHVAEVVVAVDENRRPGSWLALDE